MSDPSLVDVETVAGNWGAVALRGVAGVLFGLVTFFAPVVSLAALILVFGAYALADGILAIVTAVRRRTRTDRWWVLLLHGVAGIAAGLVALFWPGITALALLYVIAGWAVVTGLFEVAAAIRLRRRIDHEWLLVLSGVASLALGILLMLFPGTGALALVLWIGAYALVSGALLIGLGFELRSWRRSHPRRPALGTA